MCLSVTIPTRSYRMNVETLIPWRKSDYKMATILSAVLALSNSRLYSSTNVQEYFKTRAICSSKDVFAEDKGEADVPHLTGCMISQEVNNFFSVF